ncbi:sensor histidine kinase [Paenibacillus sp. TAB 01]|uniref:sensor histidine kinase n=1 Tax=Paenibacillus sp. TAB 01 TaxID=3368988 RepID=UPI003753BECC
MVENAVKHGLLSRSKGGTVHIRVARLDGAALVEVKDDGIGMSQEQVELLLQPTMRGRGGIGVWPTRTGG